MPQQSINALDRRRYSSNNDSLAGAVTRSTEQTILVSDMISEGPIEGLVGGGQGIFLDNDALQSIEQTALRPQAGVNATFTANSATVTVNPGSSTFQAAVGNDGTKYLMVYGVYSTSVTMSVINTPTSGYVFAGNPFSSVSGQVKRIPIGGNVVLTRTAGDIATSGNFMALSWAHPAANNGAAIVTAPATNSLFVNLKLSKSLHDLRGGLSSIDVDDQTAKFTWGGQLGWKLLMSDADRANGVVHTLEAGVFLEIASISGNTITLTQALPSDWATDEYRFGITAAIDGTEKGKIEEKYRNSGYSFNSGTADQDPLPTIEGVGTSSVALSVSDAALDYNAPRTITASGAQASEIDEVKFLINYPQGIYRVSESSGREYTAGVGYKIELSIDSGSGDEFIPVPGPTGKVYNGDQVWVHSGKYKSAVQFEMRLNLEQYQPFNGFKLKITRVTKHDNLGYAVYADLDHDSVARYKGVYTSTISSIIGIIKEKLSFPHTAMANVSFSSKSFDSIPTRTYLCQGLKVKVPSNYVTREQGDMLNAKYTRNAAGEITNVAQLWDGSFLQDSEGNDILVYTDNPAWIFYDVLINNRYGLGDFLKTEDIDKYSLYKISKYCDELVPDGKGGQEPRFRANIYLTKATDSYKVLKDMATIFRGILYWTDATFRPVIDQKTEPVYTFSRSNVIDGSFNYETTGTKTRINQIVVEWSNPESDYKLEPIIIEDRENQIRTGIIKSEKAVAFGCTSEGQAIRYGRWKLWTALNQTEIINFSTSVNAAFLSPGDVVNIQDEADFNIAFSGRVSSCTTSDITIDRAISSDFSAGYTYTIAVILPKRTVLLNQDSAVIDDNGGGTSTYTRGDNITHADVQGTTTQLLYKTTGTVSGAVNNSINVTLSASNSLINVGDTITGTSVDNNITVAAISGTSLTLSAAQTISDTTSLTFENEDLTRRQIESAVDTSGALLNLQYVTETVVEERTLTTGSTTTEDGRDTIPISSAFSVLPTNGDVWAIKQVSTSGETTAASYKQYKILAISETGEEKYGIVAAEYSAQKFDSVDSEFLLAVADPLFPPENTEEVPPPLNLRILTESDPDQKGEEVTVEWDSPLAVGSSGVSTTYQHLAYFKVYQTFRKIGGFSGAFGEFGGALEFLKEGTIVKSDERSLKYSGVRNGIHTVAVQTVSGNGRTSKKVSATIDIDDVFEGNFPRLGGLVKGGYSTSDVEVIDSGSQKGAVKFSVDNYVAAPLQNISSAKRNTTADANTYSLDCTALANSSWPYQEDGVDLGYLMMDFSLLDAANGSANALRLITRKIDTTTYGRSLSYWYDGIKYIADANSIWTSLGTCAITQGSNKIVGSGFSSLALGTVIIVGSSYGAKVALIESDTVMYTDYPWTAATVSSEAIKRQELVIDYGEDFLITPVSYNASGTDSASVSGKYALGGENNTMSFLQITPDLASVGRSIVVQSSLPSLSYDADEAQLTTIPSSGIVLTADAIGFSDPEFKFTGTGFGQTTSSIVAETAFTSGTNSSINKTVHADATAIAYSVTPMDFTVTAREKLDPDNALKTKATNFSINKLKEGSAGNSSALIYLYKMSENIPASIDDTNAFPTVTVSMTTGKIVAATGYSISSNQIMDAGGTGTGWYTVLTNTNVTDGVQWVSAASVSSAGDSDTIARTEWTDPVQFSGLGGLTGASVNIVFARNDGAPATPTTSSGIPTENIQWYDSPPAGTDLLWASRGSKAADADNFIWTAPFQIEGAAVAEVYIYKKHTASENDISGGTYNFVTNVLDPPTGWSKDPVSLAAHGDKIYVSVGLATGASTATAASINWGTSAVYAEKTDGINSAVAELYQLPANSADTPGTAPGDPNATLIYTFADGKLKNSGGAESGTGFNSWVKDATSPTETHKYLWKITAPAIAVTATDEITTANWAAAILAAQFGAEGDEGDVGKRTFHSTMYYGTGRTAAQGAIAAPGNSGSFAFSGQTFGTTNTVVRDTLTADKWSLVSPTFAPYDGSDNKLYWYACSVNVEETDSEGGVGVPTFSNVHVIHNFSGVVAFTDLSDPDSAITTIHGGHITTGTIQGPNFGGTTAEGTNRGMKIILDPPNASNTTTLIEARSQGATKFSLKQDGSAYFAGEIYTGEFTGGGTLKGAGSALTVGAAEQIVLDGNGQQIRITDGTNTRVILGKLS